MKHTVKNENITISSKTHTQKKNYENTHRMNLYQDRDVNDVRCRGKGTQTPILSFVRRLRDTWLTTQVSAGQGCQVEMLLLGTLLLEPPRGEHRCNWGAGWDPGALPRESASDSVSPGSGRGL